MIVTVFSKYLERLFLRHPHHIFRSIETVTTEFAEGSLKCQNVFDQDVPILSFQVVREWTESASIDGGMNTSSALPHIPSIRFALMRSLRPIVTAFFGCHQLYSFMRLSTSLFRFIIHSRTFLLHLLFYK